MSDALIDLDAWQATSVMLDHPNSVQLFQLFSLN